jgi:hypothetical protein
MINRYLVGFTKLCLVYEERVVDAYTIQEAKDKILESDTTGHHTDEWVVEDMSFQEIKNVKHLCAMEESNAI